MRAAALALLAALAAGPARAANRDAQECPAGTVRIATNRVYEPFKCVKQLDTSTPFINMKSTFKIRECPRGSRPVETPGLGTGRRYRCVMDGPAETADPQADPSLAPEDPAHPQAAAAPPGAPAAFRPPEAYLRFTVRSQFQVELPKGWHVHDGWTDEVPTFYGEFDTGRNGKQLQLVIAKQVKGQEGWVDLDTAVARDKEWQNAAESRPSRVAGFPARETYVSKASRTTYVAYDGYGYYTLSYSAPEDLFSVYEPAYRRMLESFTLSKTGL